MKTLLSFVILAFVAVAQQPPLRPVVVTLTSSATDTYAGTAAPTLGAYVTGQIIMFTANSANVGAASINVDSVGALTIVKLQGAINTTLADNDIRSGQSVLCRYDGTNCQLISPVGNAAAGGSSLGFVYSAGPWSSTGSATVVSLVQGATATTQSTTNYLRVSSPVPAGCTARNLMVSTAGLNQASGGTLDVTLYNGATATALTCSVAIGTSSCSDTSNTVALAAGDLISFRTANGSATVQTYTLASFQCN